MAKFANGIEKQKLKDFIIEKRIGGRDGHVTYRVIAAESKHILKGGFRRKADAEAYIREFVRKMNDFLEKLDPILIEKLDEYIDTHLEYNRSQKY